MPESQPSTPFDRIRTAKTSGEEAAKKHETSKKLAELGVELAYVAQAELLTRVAEKVAAKNPDSTLVKQIQDFLFQVNRCFEFHPSRIVDDGDAINLEYYMNDEVGWMNDGLILLADIEKELGPTWREDLNVETK